MSRLRSLVAWLEEKSDWLSPLVVKEVRQVVRGREFMFSFGGSLLAGLVVAFVGAVDALGGNTSSGPWTFAALMGCLSFLGLAVVPLGAFSALRNERMEQTLDLITLTSLSTRRIVIGKLMAQTVKLATFFAAMAPFITMSFLLGGIDFVTILLSLAGLFMFSMWTGALCLLLSTAFKSRAMSGVVFGAVGLLTIFLLVSGISLFVAASRGGVIGRPFGLIGSGAAMWWTLAIVTTLWLVTLVNLILLAENRLSLPTEDSVTPLRIAFFAEFLLVLAWPVSYFRDTASAVRVATEVLSVFGSAHIAMVAYFVVSEDLAVPRLVQYRMTVASRWRWLLATFGPGAGRGAAYVLVQVACLFAAIMVLRPSAMQLRWLTAACGYLCFFTGVPTLILRTLMPVRATPVKLRVGMLLAVAASLVVPDILFYLIERPEVLNIHFSRRHLINPFATLGSWRTVETQVLWPIVFGIGFMGVVAYLGLIQLAARAAGRTVPIGPADPHRPAPVAGEAGRGDVLY